MRVNPQAHTEQPEVPPAPITGEASDPPLSFLILLWVPVFAVVTWGMMLLFGRRPWDFSPDRLPLPDPHPHEPLEGREPEEPSPPGSA